MKTRVVLFFLFFCINNFSQTVVSPEFSELKGMEDQEGNTHLFYRIRSDTIIGQNYLSLKNDIYNFNVLLGTDSLFLPDKVIGNENGTDFHHVYDYDFWNNDVSKYIYGGTSGDFYPYTYINRFDYLGPLFYQWQGRVDKISISKLNDSLIYVGCWANDIGGQNPFRTSKSTDGGYNWQTVSDTMEFIEVMPNDDQSFFCFLNNDYSQNYDGKLYKTTNGGIDFYLVDTLKNGQESESEDEIKLDKNYNYIYRVFKSAYFGYVLSVSSNKGNPFTWQTKFSSGSKIFLSVDNSISGTIYLASGKQILYSTDYGNSFNVFRNLKKNIVGIYKKPNSDKLYAATKYRIYEMNVSYDSLKIIKSITPASENFDWLPLAVGNLWVYENYHIENRDFIFSGYSWNYIHGTVKLSNEKNYFEMIDRNSNGIIDTLYLRYDSLTADIYMYDFSKEEDILYEKLSAERGDTICYDNPYFWDCQIVQNEEPITVWDLSTQKKDIYPNAVGWICDHSLVKGIGLYGSGCADLYGWSANLIGCVINGIVYGDTSAVTDVKRVPSVNVFSYKLEQNYPNPFNPATNIGFRIANFGLVTLKIYDVLGKEITTLVNEYKPAGNYNVKFDASSLPSGIYFYQLKTGDFVQTNKMILIK